ncbi:MAG: hypothetical protein JWO89_328, partial [Verrucomicrobiaceae bacterium]|nr:hypothetical protein [Verrucomicrobiaceae bacterium]
MKLNLCLIVALYLALDVCVWHGPMERFARQQLSAPPAATVHGQVITEGDLDQAVQADCFRKGVNLATLDEPTREEIRKQVLGRMVDGALVRVARIANTSPRQSAKGVDEELR